MKAVWVGYTRKACAVLAEMATHVPSLNVGAGPGNPFVCAAGFTSIVRYRVSNNRPSC